MLSEKDLWQRIRQLQGQTVYTLDRRRPNRVARVTDEEIEIEGRVTKPNRGDVAEVYRQLWQKGEITGAELLGEESVLGNAFSNKVGRIILAALAAAAPDEMETVDRSGLHGLSGVKLKDLPTD